MKKKSAIDIKSTLKKIFAIVLFVAGSTTIRAQIPAADSAAIMKAMNDVSSKIESALKADKTLYNEMNDAMKKISMITDTALLDAALDAYKTKYLTQYGAIVKKAGIDMNEVASNLKAKFPKYSFLVNNYYAIEFQTLSKPPSNLEYKEGSPTSTTTTTSISDFDKTKTEGCMAVSGSKVSFDGKKVHCWAGAALLGGCESEGVLTNHTNLPSDAKSIVLKTKFTLRAKGYAVAVGGVSSCSSFGASRVSTINSGNYHTVFGDFVGDYAVAPVLWYAKYDKTQEFSHTSDLTQYKGQRLEILGDVMSFAIAGVVCATRGDGFSTIRLADLTVTR